MPDHASHFSRWAEGSRSARSQLRGELDLCYGSHVGESLDVFPAPGFSGNPQRAPGAPVLVFIHGGYWRSLDKADHSFVAPSFVQHGACVVVPNYALCPAVTIPEITLQIVMALARTWRNIERYGGDAQRITVVGHSAGGHLAAMLRVCDWKVVPKGLACRIGAQCAVHLRPV